MDEAAKNGHLDVLRWLHENRQEGCTGGAMDMASRHGHLEVSSKVSQSRSSFLCIMYIIYSRSCIGRFEMLCSICKN